MRKFSAGSRRGVIFYATARASDLDKIFKNSAKEFRARYADLFEEIRNSPITEESKRNKYSAHRTFSEILVSERIYRFEDIPNDPAILEKAAVYLTAKKLSKGNQSNILRHIRKFCEIVLLIEFPVDASSGPRRSKNTQQPLPPKGPAT